MTLVELIEALDGYPDHLRVAIEMPDDKSRYAVEGVHFDADSNRVIIEVG